MDFEWVDTMPEQVGTYAETIGPDEYLLIPIYGRRTVWLPMARSWGRQVRVRGFGGLYWINEELSQLKV